MKESLQNNTSLDIGIEFRKLERFGGASRTRRKDVIVICKHETNFYLIESTKTNHIYSTRMMEIFLLGAALCFHKVFKTSRVVYFHFTYSRIASFHPPISKFGKLIVSSYSSENIPEISTLIDPVDPVVIARHSSALQVVLAPFLSTVKICPDENRKGLQVFREAVRRFCISISASNETATPEISYPI